MAKAKLKKLTFNEKNVLKEMAKELDCKVDELSIEDYDPGFGTPDMFRVELGRQEYYVAPDDDAAHDLAVAMVTQDLEHEPEIFNKGFIESHIDTDQLRKALYSDLQSSRYEDLKYEAEQRPEQFIKDNNLDWPEPSDALLKKHADAMGDTPEEAAKIYQDLLDMDAESKWIEMGEEPEVKDLDIEDIAEGEAEAALKDPMSYLEDIYGKEDAVTRAIEIAGIDIRAAADEAVSTDGEGHFLGTYDGNINNTHSGFVYWRHN